MRRALLVCLPLLLAGTDASARQNPPKEPAADVNRPRGNPQDELAAAYAKLDALDTYRERITFRFESMGMADMDEMELEGDLGNRIKAMMAPFKRGFVRENVGKGLSRLVWSFPNPSPIGSEITVESIEQGSQWATRYDDPKMRATAGAINAAAQAQMAANSAISTARALAGAAVDPFGAIGDLMSMGMQAAASARAAAGKRDDDMGKWVCRTDEPIKDQSANAPVELKAPGTVGGKPVRRYRVLAPPGVTEFAPHVVSVDEASGLPVQVEVMNEDDQVVTVVEFYDFNAPMTIEFPKCDKHR